MNSLTITPQAPASGRRHGRSLAFASYQAITGPCSDAPSRSGGAEGEGEGTDAAECVGKVMALESCHVHTSRPLAAPLAGG